ncbi:MAG TPA: DedA family protein [Candidatus Dormibacteraeota bacterium]
MAIQWRVPGWLQTPSWYRPLSRLFGHWVREHQALGVFGAIFAEELGVPLPAPGDVVVALAGYLTTTHALALWSAYVAVVVGATLGATCLFLLSRRFGQPFVLRFGRYAGLTEERFERAERTFRRWGPWAIIFGRHIPGLRIYLSALAGIFGVRLIVFVPSVFVSAAAWAAIFLTIGRLLGPRSRFLFRLLPAHLVPWFLAVLVVIGLVVIAWERGWRPGFLNSRRTPTPSPPEVPKGQVELHKT